MSEAREIPGLEFGEWEEEKNDLVRLLPDGDYDLQFKSYEYNDEYGSVSFTFSVLNCSEAEWNGFQIFHRPYLTDYNNDQLPSKAYKATILAICKDQIKEAAENGEKFRLLPSDVISGEAEPLRDAIGTITNAHVEINKWENTDKGTSGENNKVKKFNL